MTGSGAVDLPRRFAQEMGALLGPDFPPHIGLAVSGGGDSMAMLHLAAPWARVMGLQLWAATIDHGLRAESAGEAAMVATACADLGVPHSTLRWQGWDGQGNLQAAARAARHDLLNRWRGCVGHILFAHTQDDQAETVLMRMARGSGVEGLAGMAPMQVIQDFAHPAETLDVGAMPPKPAIRSADWRLLRPLLTTTRAELRHYNRVLHIPYVDDPTNDDPSYDRVKARQALAALAPLGLTPKRLAETAARMARARLALDRLAEQAAASCVRVARYDVQIDRDGFAALDPDTRLRLLSRALQMVASNRYRPRAAPLEALVERVLAGGEGVLHGAQVLVRRDLIWVIREAKAIEGHRVPAGPGAPWDRRVLCQGPHIAGFDIRALGEDGLAQLAEKPADVPRAALRVTPAIFDGPLLVACQRLGFGLSYREDHVPNPAMFSPQD